ncbi:(2Fe-2S) ferredoxin domain-containing protein [Pseudomonas paeninsulae]|uniref:(2Fe-2S) ferredoxin domain-containing protein n=1 Tax=Pseudomonas paeninsulae TaxID=3110772 RepID=UPI002D79F2FD|nr:(2Fe-2S) ferredoxin domain-containing protein [Pseudomonas sp. IT1137]
MTTPVSPYACILFVGPDLADGSFAELFRQRLAALRGAAALADIVDTSSGYAELWQRVSEGQRPLLVIDLEPQSSSPHLDWLRSELGQLAEAEQLFVASAIGQSEGLPVEVACALIERPELHLPCVGVAAIPGHHAWSQIPPHQQRLLLCNGPRCTRRGALALWKSLRARLKAAGKLECAGGVHITRTQCQFPCDQGPTLSVYPSGDWYRVRNEAEVIRLVDEHFVGGRQVAELLMPRG